MLPEDDNTVTKTVDKPQTVTVTVADLQQMISEAVAAREAELNPPPKVLTPLEQLQAYIDAGYRHVQGDQRMPSGSGPAHDAMLAGLQIVHDLLVKGGTN